MTSSAGSPNPPRSESLPFPLQDGERVIEICRRHWIYLWPMLAAQILAGVVPVLFFAWLIDAVGIHGTVSRIFLLVAAIYLVYWAVRVALTWYRFRNDIWVVTNQRLIDSYRRHPFDMSISTADLVNVQDMSVERTGILRTMLDYGDIICKTASGDMDFDITGVPKPRDTQALVDRERDRERSRLYGV
jgi:hypothetical protein